MADAFIITRFNHKTQRHSYWQTPWISRVRVLNQDGTAAYDENRRPLFAVNEDGSPQYKDIGGWVGKAEYATKYDDQTEAETVNGLRMLHATVEKW